MLLLLLDFVQLKLTVPRYLSPYNCVSVHHFWCEVTWYVLRQTHIMLAWYKGSNEFNVSAKYHNSFLCFCFYGCRYAIELLLPIWFCILYWFNHWFCILYWLSHWFCMLYWFNQCHTSCLFYDLSDLVLMSL